MEQKIEGFQAGKNLSIDTVVLFSGGLDSTVLLYHLLDMGRRPFALHFSYGARHGSKEKKSARQIAAARDVPLAEVSMPFIAEGFQSSLLMGGQELPKGRYTETLKMKSTVVPARNSIFVAVAAGYAESFGANSIALASNAADHDTYPDTRPEWIEAMQAVLSTGTYGQPKLETPFCNWQKKDILLHGKKLGVPFEKTWTCYAGNEVPCRQCGACSARAEGFLETGLKDPLLQIFSSQSCSSSPSFELS